MTRREDADRLGHMLEFAGKAVAFCHGRARADLDRDEMLALAVVRLIELIGEAARQVSPEFRAHHPQIEWAPIIAARNRLVHGYTDIDLDVVWEIVGRDLPALVAELEKLVPPDRA